MRQFLMIGIAAIGFTLTAGCDYRPWPPLEDMPNVPGTCDEQAPFGGELCNGNHDNIPGALRVMLEPDESNWTELDLEIEWRSRSKTDNDWIRFDNTEPLLPVVYDIIGGDSSGATFWATMPNVPSDAEIRIYGNIHSEVGYSDVVFCDNDPGGVIEAWVGPYDQLDVRVDNDCYLDIEADDLL